jgi:crotonobetainyl-CoA:carnitine CoA-transferase CaiB-like acyl-CoA transferase
MQTAGAPHLWGRIVAAMGRPELKDDVRFVTVAARRANWGALVKIVREWLEGFDSVTSAVETLSRARIPSVPMLSPEEVVQHPHLAARSAFPEVPHASRGKVRVTAAPFQVDGRAVHPGGPAPYNVGEHTRAVLRDVLGYPEERIESLRQGGVVA